MMSATSWEGTAYPSRAPEFLYPRSIGGGILFYLCPSFRLSVRPKIFFIVFFSVTIDGRNMMFGHKLHTGTPYRGKLRGYHRWTLPNSSSCFMWDQSSFLCYVYLTIVCLFVCLSFDHFINILSIHHQYTVSDYPSTIFKLFSFDIPVSDFILAYTMNERINMERWSRLVWLVLFICRCFDQYMSNNFVFINMRYICLCMRCLHLFIPVYMLSFLSEA